MKIYYNEVRQDPQNCKYPLCIEVACAADLEKVVRYDHVCASYLNYYRKNANFLQADCNMFDVDNAETDNPDDWVGPEQVQKAFPNVPFYVSYSRNHMKEKNRKAPRPKFHVYFPDATFTDAAEYAAHKKAVCSYFPAFDPNARDSARFFYGVEYPQVEFYSGEVLLYDFMKTVVIPEDYTDAKKVGDHEESANEMFIVQKPETIPQGQRNSTMHRFALSYLTRYGDTSGKAYRKFMQESVKCNPPLDCDELASIWKSASKYYQQTIKLAPDYIPPEAFERQSTHQKLELPIVDEMSIKKLCAIQKAERILDIANTRLLLEAHGITVRLNEMNYFIEVSGLPEQYRGEGAFDTLCTLLADEASNLHLRQARKTIAAQNLEAIAKEHHYHPVIKLLESKSWDKTDRLPEIYRMLGITEAFYQILVKKWALQTIAVLYSRLDAPVAAQGVLVLQGAQGIGKTEFFRHLAINDDFFKGGATLDMSNKDSLISATQVWICELGEIDSTTKKQQPALKAFLTEPRDRFRVPYARHETIRPRKTAFCGTVNPQKYLWDETGNRRFWTIPVEKIDLNCIFHYPAEWYAQFWRQIQTEYNQNPKGYLLTKSEQECVNLRNAEFEVDVHGEDEFLTLFDVSAPKSNWQWRTAAEIAQILNNLYRDLHFKSQDIHKLLSRIGDRTGVTFESKALRGKRLIHFPPMRDETDDTSLEYTGILWQNDCANDVAHLSKEESQSADDEEYIVEF